MTRLESARQAYRAALVEERDAILAELAALGADDPAPKPPPRGRVVRAGKKSMRPSESGRLGGLKKAANAKAHGVPGKPGVVQGERKGEYSCPGCGREELPKSQGPGGYMAFHRAPCGLICAAINLDRVEPEDKEGGIHSKRNCPKCSKAASA